MKLRRLTKRKPADPRRDELKRIIRAADFLPWTVKTAAIIGVAKISDDDVKKALELFPEFITAAKSGDRDGLRALMAKGGVLSDDIDDAMMYYDKMADMNGDKADH